MINNNIEKLIKDLEETGFKASSENVSLTINNINNLKEYKKKIIKAYQNYKFVDEDVINDLRSKLQNSNKNNNSIYLKFYNLENYPNIPPKEVLEKIKEISALNIFDFFKILTIYNSSNGKIIEEFPIIFGCINGTEKEVLFFIHQWDKNLKIKDFL